MDALLSERPSGPVQPNLVPMPSDDQQPPAIIQDEDHWKKSCVLTLGMEPAWCFEECFTDTSQMVVALEDTQVFAW